MLIAFISCNFPWTRMELPNMIAAPGEIGSVLGLRGSMGTEYRRININMRGPHAKEDETLVLGPNAKFTIQNDLFYQ